MILWLLWIGLTLGGAGAGPQIRAGADTTSLEITADLPAKVARTLPDGKMIQEQGEKLLQFFLCDGTKEGPPMLGHYEKRGTVLVFRPRFPLEPGKTYRARLTLPETTVTTADYRVPALPDLPPAVVEKIFPTSGELPANNLKFYIYFSRPMRGGKDIFDQIVLLDDKGQPVFDPWLRDELWGADDHLLILYIHPGRIKWGVLLRQLLGPVLLPGREYTLVIGGDMLDDRGQRLGKDWTKKFRTTAEDRTFVNLGDWKIQAPPANTKQSLDVYFPKALDHKSLGRFLTILDPDGKVIAGKAVVGPDEKSWAFHPEQPWQAVAYTLSVHGRLEDVAGNTPLRPFDLDLQAPSPPRQILNLTFRPVAAP